MGNEWQSWYGHRGGRGAHRERSFVPIVRFRRRGPSAWQGVLVALGMALAGGLGVGWSLVVGDPTDRGPSAPIDWNAVQAVPQATPDPADADWLARGREEVGGDLSTASKAAVSTRFGLCHSGGGTNCVVDGDTIWFQGDNIRIADIDAPETHDPRCAAEQVLGDRATRRLHVLVNSGAVTLGSIGRDEDRYGRKLRTVAVDGASVGGTLVGEGLARWYGGGRRPWC